MLDMIRSRLCAFRDNEDGIVTADFVVLLSTIALLGIAVVGTFNDEVVDLSDNIASNIASVEVTP